MRNAIAGIGFGLVATVLVFTPATAEDTVSRRSLGEISRPSANPAAKKVPTATPSEKMPAAKKATLARPKATARAINIPEPQGWKCVVKGRIEANIWKDFIGEAATANQAQAEAYGACQAVDASCGTAQCTATY